MRTVIFMVLLMAIALNGNGQSSKVGKSLQVGKSFPFILNDVNYFRKNTTIQDDFKGKWLILDFWNSGCGACIANFPKMNNLQKEFNDNLQIVSIGYTGSIYEGRSEENFIKILYEKLRKKMSLITPIAYDSTLFKQIGIKGCPFIIVIDPKGVVRGITTAINEKDVDKFLAGQTPILESATYTGAANLIPEQKIKISCNRDMSAEEEFSILWQSTLALSDPGAGWKSFPINFKDTNKLVVNLMLKELYRYAYFGVEDWDMNSTELYQTYRINPLLAIKDSAFFDSNQKFSYSIINQNKKGKQYFMTALQQDLQRSFGYYAAIETLELPCWVLVVKNKSLVKFSKTSEIIPKHNYHEDSNYLKFTGINIPVYTLLSTIQARNVLVSRDTPFFDATGITTKIDIEINCLMSDLEALKQELQRNGFDLVLQNRKLKVLVIGDSKTH